MLVVSLKLSVFLEQRKQRLLLRLKATNVVDRTSQYWAFVPATTLAVHTHIHRCPP